MSQITLTLSDDITSALSQIGRESNRKPEEVAREMLEKAVALKRLDQLRGEVRESLKPDAPKTEDETFEQIS